MFRYRKLYADLISERGDVCVAYVTSLELLGVKQQTAGYEWYPHDGERRVVRASGVAHVEAADGNVKIRFPTPEGEFALELRSSVAPPLASQSVAPRLRWCVVADRAVGLLSAPFATDLGGQSYADRVEMAAPPRALRLSSLEWGRSHTATQSLVFTRAVFRDGSEFLSGAVRLTRQGDTSLQVELNRSLVTLHNQRVLHAGPALDAARFPSRVERAFVRACSGRIEETRWLARAAFPDGVSAPAVHESVHWLS